MSNLKEETEEERLRRAQAVETLLPINKMENKTLLRDVLAQSPLAGADPSTALRRRASDCAAVGNLESSRPPTGQVELWVVGV